MCCLYWCDNNNESTNVLNLWRLCKPLTPNMVVTVAFVDCVCQSYLQIYSQPRFLFDGDLVLLHSPHLGSFWLSAMHWSDYNNDVIIRHGHDLLIMIAVLWMYFLPPSPRHCSHVTDNIIAIPIFPCHVTFIELLTMTMMTRMAS